MREHKESTLYSKHLQNCAQIVPVIFMVQKKKISYQVSGLCEESLAHAGTSDQRQSVVDNNAPQALLVLCEPSGCGLKTAKAQNRGETD